MLQDVPFLKTAEVTAVIPTDFNGFCCRPFPYYKSSALSGSVLQTSCAPSLGRSNRESFHFSWDLKTI